MLARFLCMRFGAADRSGKLGLFTKGGTMDGTPLPEQGLHVRQQSLLQVILFHLVPGVIITGVFSGIAALMSPSGLPASLALLTTWLVAGVPLLLGILLYQGWRQNGRPSLS